MATKNTETKSIFKTNPVAENRKREMLAEYASQWVEAVAVPICEHADELLADPAFLHLLAEWHNAKTRHDRDYRRYLASLANANSDSERKAQRREWQDHETLHKMDRSTASELSMVMHDMLDLDMLDLD